MVNDEDGENAEKTGMQLWYLFHFVQKYAYGVVVGGGVVTGLRLSPKKCQFFALFPKVSSYSLIFADRHVAPLKVGCWQWGANLHSCIFTHFPFPINPLVSLQKWQCAGNFYHYNLNMAEDESICEGVSFPSTFSLCQPCFSWSKTYPLYHGETGKNVQALIQSLKLLGLFGHFLAYIVKSYH